MDFSLYCQNATAIDLTGFFPYCERVARAALTRLKKKGKHLISLTVVDDKKIREINREYRSIDKATDVISFAYNDADERLVNDANVPNDLGEIVVSVDTARKEAAEHNRDLIAEMGFLFLHGLLHLLGYDHATPAEEKIMFDLQDEILRIVKLNEVKDMETKEKLLQEAIEAQKLSYSPYSHFKVGAAVLLKDGVIVKGANIENAAYGLTLCAERNAVFGAYCRGYKKEDVVALAVTSSGDDIVTPCGSCRQVLIELCAPETPVYLGNKGGKSMETTVRDLLPFAFDKDYL